MMPGESLTSQAVLRTPGIDVGANYLDVCRSAARAGDHSVVTEVLAGIEGVLSGKETEFQNEYPCVHRLPGPLV